MDVRTVLRSLPPFEHERDIVVKGNQSINDIETLVLKTHELTAGDYDKIARYFDHKDAPKRLFEFVSRLKYKEEPKKDQTTRSPAGILELADGKGIDCKHMAGFIAGVLDALNRTGKYQFDWFYRFVSYDRKDKSPTHVYVVLKDTDTWLDPAPVKDRWQVYRARSYNDRMAIPTFYAETTLNMLSYLHGAHYYVTEDQQSSCMGCANNIGVIDAGVIEKAAGAIKETSRKVADMLPDGGLKNFLNTFMDDPVDALLSIFVGRTYTSGEYVLGEQYMRNILGMMEIQKRSQVPDDYVPQAEMFFSTALGIPIGSSDHLNALVRSEGDYMNWAGGTFAWVDQSQVARARTILTTHIGWTTSYFPRDVRWPLAAFGAIPYIYPIHNPVNGITQADRTLFSGTHPILNIEFANGYPKTTGTQTPGTQTPGTQTPGTQTPGIENLIDQTPIPKKAGMNWLPIALIGAGVIYAANRKKG